MFAMQAQGSEDRDELLQRLLREVHLLGARLAQSHQRTADAVGIGVTDLLCLGMISAGEPVTAGRLAELVQLTPGAVTGILDRLERGGFIKRDRDPEDRRRVLVRLDPERQRDMAQLLDPLAGALGEVTADLPEGELRQITDFLARLRSATTAELVRMRPRNTVHPGSATTVISRASVSRARLEIAAGLFDVTVSAGDLGDDLLHSTFDGQQPRIEREGATVTVRQRRLSAYFGWAGPGVIRLHDGVAWDLELRGGSYRLALQLQDLPHLRSLTLRSGTKVSALLPAPVGTVGIAVSGGFNDLTLERPEGVPVRVTAHGGVSQLGVDDLRVAAADQTDWRSPGYDEAADRYDITLTGGVSKLSVGSF